MSEQHELHLLCKAERTYGSRDRERGPAATLAWLAEELGELARAVRKGTPDEQLHELGDVLAWLASLAAQLGLSLEDAARRYAGGCPKFGALPAPVRDLRLSVTGRSRGPEPRRQPPALTAGRYLRAISSSAICTALSAAPLRRLSPTQNRASPFSAVASARIRPT